MKPPRYYPRTHTPKTRKDIRAQYSLKARIKRKARQLLHKLTLRLR